MDAIFPTGFPGPTALYLTLYVLTLAVHAICVTYVLTGSAWVAASAVRAAVRGGGTERGPVAELFADWLPFSVGAAITAGVAPLLFLQILYRESFYTASLLLFNRWMAVVPVLVVGFYLLYASKTHRVHGWSPARRAALAVLSWLCFAFVAYSFTEMHLLALDQQAWVPFYASESLFYSSAAKLPRAAMWLAAALPVAVTIMGWQLWRAAPEEAAMGAATRRLSLTGLLGLAGAAAAGLALRAAMSEAGRAALWSPMARPYAVLALVGALCLAVSWTLMLRRKQVSGLLLMVASAGALQLVVGGAVVREGVRLARLGNEQLFALHARAAEAGGMPVFLFFLVVNSAVVYGCFRMVRRGLSRANDAR